MRLLLAEDEEAMAEAVVDYLEYHHYEVDWANNGTDALERARMGTYDVLILDIMMPGMDGLTVLRTLRGEGDTTPVLLLTAKGEIRDKVQGFESGSDDYLTKPFAMEELRVRVDALTRRSQNYQGEQVAFEDLTLDVQSAVLRCGGESVQLSRKEFEVMKTFLYNPTMTITKDALISSVWGMDSEATDNNVEVYISFLRKKLKYLKSRVSIKNLQKIGYRLEVEPC